MRYWEIAWIFCVKGNGKGEINENFYVWPIYKGENKCKMGVKKGKKIRFEMDQRDVTKYEILN